MVTRALLDSVDALSVDDQVALVEHINGRLAALTHTDVNDQALIDGRAHDVDERHWSSVTDFDRRIRARRV